MTNKKENTLKIKRYLLALLPSSINNNSQNSNTKRIIKNITWLLGDKAFQLIIGLLVGAWVARYLGPSSFGEISYILALVGIFQIVSQLGINNIAVRELSTAKELCGDIIGTLFRLRMISGILCFSGAVFSFYLLNPENNSNLLIAAIISGILIFQPSETIDLWFQSELKSKRTVYAKLISSVIANAIKVVLILLKMPLIAFAIILLVEAVAFTLALLHSYKKHSVFGYGSWNTNICKKMLQEGAPFFLSGLLLVAYIQFDKVLVAKIGSPAEAGYYVVAITLTSIFNALPMIICMSLAPLLTTLDTEKKRFDIFTKLYAGLFLAAATFSFLLIIFSEKIIFFLYGSAYHASILVTKILAVSIIPVFISIANDYLALTKKTSHITLIRTIFGLVTSLILSIVLIPKYGAIGAALATTIAHWLSNTILYWLIMREAFFLQTKGLIIPFYYLLKKIKFK